MKKNFKKPIHDKPKASRMQRLGPHTSLVGTSGAQPLGKAGAVCTNQNTQLPDAPGTAVKGIS